MRRLWLVVALAMVGALDLDALPSDRAISQYVRKSWTVETGLPHGTVRGIAQTADGYLWLATYEGLVRFNGETFRVFDKTNAPGLLNSSIDTLSSTADGTLWLGTFDGLVRVRNGRFETIPLETDFGIIKAIAGARDGSVWVGTAKGRIIHVTQRGPRELRLPLPLSPITALALTGDTLWLGTSRGLFRYAGGRLEPIAGLASDAVVTLLAHDDELLIGTATGLDRFAQGRVVPIDGLPKDQVTALHHDRDGNLWIGTYGNGVFRLTGTRLARYGIADGLLNPTIRTIFEDDEGSIWIGSQNGLEQLRVGAFITWNERDGLADDHARAVFEDREGVMWVGTATSLNRWENGRWIPVADEGLSRILAIAQTRDGAHWFGTTNGVYRIRDGRKTLFTTQQGLSNNSIRDIHEDRRGDVWIATDFGLNRIRRDDSIESFAGRGGLGAEYAIAITETNDGRIWVATGGGLGELRGDRFVLHAAPKELPSNRLFALEAEDGGTVWIATESDGLIRFKDGRASTITTRQGLPSDKILSLVDDGKGNLWFGTVRGAFSASRRDLNAVADGTLAQLRTSFYDENDGLGSRQLNGAANPAAFRSRDGRIWLVTAHGISASAITKMPPLPERAPLIERVLIDGREVAPSSLQDVARGADRIEFEFTGVTFTTPQRQHFRYRLEGYDERWFDAGTVRSASYTNLPAGEYRFVLASSRDGARWREASTPFTLKPHFYETRWFVALCVLAVIALLFAIHSVRLHLARERARLLERLVEDRTRQILEEKERTEVALREAEAAKREAERHEQLTEQALAQAEEANRAKSIFLAATSHELRTPLNAIIGFSDILISHVARQLEPRYGRFLQNIHSSGEYLLGIINNILDLSKIEAGRMDIQPEPIQLPEIINGICAVMKGVTTMRKIQLELELPGDLPLIDADPTLIRQILYNLMSNAVKFSPERSTVTIQAQAMDPGTSPLGESAVEVRVKDNGIGIAVEDQQIIFEEFRQISGPGRRPGTGLGLALVRRFVALHRGTIGVESTPGRGSTFILVLPCSQPPAVAIRTA
ncbi:MAG TPA: two-component regulator propeller domain-containing protein [Thermoanaerobaculia bacterium]|nr:two-component regulator propeller domain-containing protein [Thermoanaerobaculia bacterium]